MPGPSTFGPGEGGAGTHDLAGDPGVPVTDVTAELGTTTNLMSAEGRGVVNGIPYGEQLVTERRNHARLWKFNPAGAARLRSATRRALGR